MSDSDLLFTDDDMLPFSGPETGNPWRVLVVDDDIEVHVATRLALSDVTYLGRPPGIDECPFRARGAPAPA
jgi:hypothetical protein